MKFPKPPRPPYTPYVAGPFGTIALLWLWSWWLMKLCIYGIIALMLVVFVFGPYWIIQGIRWVRKEYSNDKPTAYIIRLPDSDAQMQGDVVHNRAEHSDDDQSSVSAPVSEGGTAR